MSNDKCWNKSKGWGCQRYYAGSTCICGYQGRVITSVLFSIVGNSRGWVWEHVIFLPYNNLEIRGPYMKFPGSNWKFWTRSQKVEVTTDLGVTHVID